VEQRGIEHDPPSGANVAKSGENPEEQATGGDSERLEILPADEEPPLLRRGTEDAVEAALAAGIAGATAAGRFYVVAQLARELEARRFARAGNVVPLDRTRRRERQ